MAFSAIPGKDFALILGNECLPNLPAEGSPGSGNQNKMQINKYKRAVDLIMQTLNDLVFTKHKPYRQVIEALGSCNGTNFDELFLHLKKTIVPEIGTWKLRRILLGL